MARLKRAEPTCGWPAVSTAGEILKRHGLVGYRRWKTAGNGPSPEPEGPNAARAGDHHGWLQTGDGWRCQPLTVMDSSCCCLLALEATGSTAEDEAWPSFELTFEQNGLPDRFRSDNGLSAEGKGACSQWLLVRQHALAA